MSRIRYFVDRPRGPRGGNNDSGPYYTLHTAQRHAAKTDEVVGYQGRLIRPARCEGVILAVDLDELKPHGVDSDREFAWHESRMQYHAGEAQRLRPGVELKTAEQFLTHEDLAELRAAIRNHFAAITWNASRCSARCSALLTSSRLPSRSSSLFSFLWWMPMPSGMGPLADSQTCRARSTHVFGSATVEEHAEDGPFADLARRAA